ncbi:cupin domain-containing protein [uncultured Pigmentiphaga sp.]|uniref:cupin domain-containing protein n=1 Tax=uncultured Pigmentiphaga sp. TaxID=340361 RepID=UPI00262348A8|nr:cupin domain-containing protein [uncultured Pigmentiphaga sp.]
MPITVLSQSATVDLPDDGPLAASLTQPPSRTGTLYVPLEGAGENRTGVWECTPGRFARQLPNAELMHILSGACTFTPEGGEPREIRAGDTLFFPAHTRGLWDVRETLRKVFVVFA